MPKQEQIACIFCGKSALLNKINIDQLGTNWSIDWKTLQIRDMLPGPGRGKKGKSKEHGFPVIEDESLTIMEMNENPAYTEVVTAIKDRLIKIVKTYIKAGIIERAELR